MHDHSANRRALDQALTQHILRVDGVLQLESVSDLILFRYQIQLLDHSRVSLKQEGYVPLSR